jgi:hypothetical protein
VIEKNKVGIAEWGAIDMLLWIVPILGLYLAIKHLRYKGILGKIYIAFGCIYNIGFVSNLYFYLK